MTENLKKQINDIFINLNLLYNDAIEIDINEMEPP